MIKLTSITFFLLLIGFSSIAQNIHYVDSSATGLDDGTSWANAFLDLQDALETAQPGEQIWVAKGVYIPAKDTNDDIAISNRRAFLLRDGVKLYGGFQGTENSVSQRKWRVNKTILSGIPPNSVQSKSYIVVLARNLDSTASMDGFYITDADNGVIRPGGSAVLIRNGNPVLSNLVLYNNRGADGGALGLHNSSSLIANVTIKKNYAWQQLSNRGSGGGIYMWGSKPVLVNCLITGNTSENRGPAISSILSQPVIINSTICNNYASGGMIYDAIHISNSSNFVIINSIVEGRIRGFGSVAAIAAIQNSIIYGSGGSTNWNTLFGIDAGGNQDVTVIHTDSVNGNYRLMDCSPGLDTGSTHLLPKDDYDLDYDGITNELFPIDIEGRPRVVNGTVDIGAYEGAFSYDTTVAELCAGSSIKLIDSTITQTGVYSFRYSRGPGLCDSVLHFSVLPKLTGLVQLDTANNTLYAKDSNATYQWYDCTNQYALPADTNQSFTPWIPSAYRVIVTKDGCTDSSACITVSKVGLNEPYSPLSVNIYPNPSKGNFQIQLSKAAGEVEISVLDINGKLVLEKISHAKATTIDLSSMPAGIYILRMYSDELGILNKRLVKE
jgi:hypothetical protein